MPLKVQDSSQARRELKIAPPHIQNMQEIIFCEQRSMAKKIGFLEVFICA
jgi:GTPase